MEHGPILICGFGSIGQRHYRNLCALGCRSFVILRRRYGGAIMPHSVTVTSLAKAFAHKPTIAVICNPTSLHIETAIECAEAGCHLFIEKPVGSGLDGLDELEAIVEEKHLVAAVGYQFRFHPKLGKLKAMLPSMGKIHRVHARWSEFLPTWHPGEDYRESYAGRDDLGGGVILTLSHVLDYLRWLFGDLEIESASTKASCDLKGGLRCADHSSLIRLRTADGGIIACDLDFGADGHAVHDLQVSAEWGQCNLDLMPTPEARNQMFVEEMKRFLLAIEMGNKGMPDYMLAEGIATLKLCLEAKRLAGLEPVHA